MRDFFNASFLRGGITMVCLGYFSQHFIGQEGAIRLAIMHWTPWYIDIPLAIVGLLVVIGTYAAEKGASITVKEGKL